MDSIILMGIKHCGKSTQGKLLAKELGIPFFDTDDIIAELTGLSPRELYSRRGETAFMQAEADSCRQLLERLQAGQSRAVVATGGGICRNDSAIDTLRRLGQLVFLLAPEKTAADRIVREARVADNGTLTNLPAYLASKNPRSLDEVRALFHTFYTERTEAYGKLADITVQMQDAPKAVNTRRILDAVRTRRT